MDSDNSNEISEVVKRIEDVSRLSTEQLIEISRELFALVSFCNCEVNKGSDRIVHQCDRFHHHDYEHTPACKCCQKRMLLYYLGRCMEKLADCGRLAQFIDANLSHARIRDRTYEHIRLVQN